MRFNPVSSAGDHAYTQSELTSSNALLAGVLNSFRIVLSVSTSAKPCQRSRPRLLSEPVSTVDSNLVQSWTQYISSMLHSETRDQTPRPQTLLGATRSKLTLPPLVQVCDTNQYTFVPHSNLRTRQTFSTLDRRAPIQTRLESHWTK